MIGQFACGFGLCLGAAVLWSGTGLLRADVVQIAPLADTFIISTFPGNNAGGHSHIAAGRDGVGGVRRGLLRFDLGAIPAGSTITSAVLRLTVVMVPITSPANSTFDLLRLTADWGEGTKFGPSGAAAAAGEATWNARLHGTANWTAAGARSDAAAVASASAPVGSSFGQTVSWSGPGLVNDLQAWLDNANPNFGWLLVSQAEGTSRTARGFGSMESGSAGALEVGYSGGSMANEPPTVAITDPADGAVFAPPADLTIQAMAMDSDGSVAQVEFFDGANSLGIDTSEPYSAMASLGSGSHALTAVATDNMGASSTSAVVNVSVGGVPIDNPIAERIAKGDITIELRTVADGMISPLGMAVPDDGSGRLFVYDQAGLVWLVTAAGRSPTPVLDLRTRLVNINGNYDERGLLGLAVHPNFAENPLLYTYTSEPVTGPADFTFAPTPEATTNHQSVIAEWRLEPASTNQADPSSRREVLRIDQPQSNHNGGTMRFGPDALLYVSLGDGGAADDEGEGHSPGGNGQDITNILGSVIRIDVDGNNGVNGQYGVPADNPLVGIAGVDEMYAWGLRNPFSFAFDRQTGELYLGDVGQNKVEEINIIENGGNYGWRFKEGTFFFDPNGSDSGFVTATPVGDVPPDLVDPIAQYDHDDGTAVIGGYVYRGTQLPELAGHYVFGDWGVFGSPSGRLYYLDEGTVKELRLGVEDRPLLRYLKGFGEDADGELYVFASEPQGPAGAGGIMYRIVPAPSAAVEITGLQTVNETNVQVQFTGGVGPYVQQRKAQLNEAVWMNEAFCTATPALVSIRSGSGFFRKLDAAQQPAVPFSARLSGEYERPNPITTDGQGFGIFSLEGNSLTFTIHYRDLSGDAFAAHIHGPASATNSAGVLIDLAPYHNGPFGTEGSFSGTIVLTDAEKADLLDGLHYVNVHTPNHTGGEIRGHIAPVLFEASLLGAYEGSGIDTPGNGLGHFLLIGNQLSFSIVYRQLSAPADMGHIHGFAPLGQNAGVIIDLAPFTVGGFGSGGAITGQVTLTPDQLAAVIDGRTYVNIHTPNHPSGEIRGQILARSTAVPLTAWISGSNERPTPLTNSVLGLGFFSLEGNWLAFSIHYSGLSGPVTLAHIHGPATTEEPAGVLVDLGPFIANGPGNNGTLSGGVALTPMQRDLILKGLTYVNVHTTANPGGEGRGQLASVLMGAGVGGPAERPNSVVTRGSALGLFLLNGARLDLNIVYKDLSEGAIAAHIHAAANSSQTAGVVIDFADFISGPYGAAGYVNGSTNLNPTVLLNVIDERSYVNFHTPMNMPGEIRGQITR